MLVYDDGRQTEVYPFVDAANSNSRIGLRFEKDFRTWSFENVYEIGYDPYSTGRVNVVDDSISDQEWQLQKSNIRRIDFIFHFAQFGDLSVGQGGMATDGVAERDLSGTGLVASSALADSASGQLFRFTGAGGPGSISGVSVGDAFANFDGSRRVRVRYDTPRFAGFGVSASYGRDLLNDSRAVREQNLFDASLSYVGGFGDFALQGATGMALRDDNDARYLASATTLHKPTGLNLTLAGGLTEGEASFVYTKVGITRDLVSWGSTSFSVDYYTGDDVNLDAGAGITSSSSDSYGLAVVQKIDAANLEVYATYRNYDYSDNSADYSDGDAVFTGVRFRF
ncbi:hypothetical protein [Albimonas pacifica]|uniref:hypothetical protein n=1 Tax=Albimonas pacifica TaxID=1114924 RepID=UPI000B89D14B|nr:hypothetical protein [Albimonas pacifica]